MPSASSIDKDTGHTHTNTHTRLSGGGRNCKALQIALSKVTSKQDHEIGNRTDNAICTMVVQDESSSGVNTYGIPAGN